MTSLMGGFIYGDVADGGGLFTVTSLAGDVHGDVADWGVIRGGVTDGGCAR